MKLVKSSVGSILLEGWSDEEWPHSLAGSCWLGLKDAFGWFAASFLKQEDELVCLQPLYQCQRLASIGVDLMSKHTILHGFAVLHLQSVDRCIVVVVAALSSSVGTAAVFS
jgi:hypothetical protein